jgi:hypothetical protein
VGAQWRRRDLLREATLSLFAAVLIMGRGKRLHVLRQT